MTKSTWRPHTVRGELDSEERGDLPKSVFAFPKQRKEPLTDANHVINALSRFNQVEDVSDADRAQAFANDNQPPALRHRGLRRKVAGARQARLRPPFWPNPQFDLDRHQGSNGPAPKRVGEGLADRCRVGR